MAASSTIASEFSFRTRDQALSRFREETFDFLIIGGGITGAATARDAASRGLKVAVVEKRDFAYGTSSRSSKLIHGGLRYLQNFEFGLVFEALAERALLLKTVPHMVRPLPFYLPVYEGDSNGRAILATGLWLYDLLALFRTPGFHRHLSREKLLEEIPFLRPERLTGGFRYFDASMWDDVLAVETLRAAHGLGAAVASYVEAVEPLWSDGRVSGFKLRDLEAPEGQGEIAVRAHRAIVCAGPWTDAVGRTLSPDWKRWLQPSKGVHLLFDLKRVPVPGAMVMSHPEDGRIAFVIPRPDFGPGVVIVGTTDGPTPQEPEKASVEPGDVAYLMGLLSKYFPGLKLQVSDILSAYVGVRPLMGGEKSAAAGDSSSVLQKVSREHHIDLGPGGATIVAGGKYTTHRKMAEEIVEFTLDAWRRDARDASKRRIPEFPHGIGKPRTKAPVNPKATFEAVAACREEAARKGLEIPPQLLSRFGGEAIDVMEIAAVARSQLPAPGAIGAMGGGSQTAAVDPEGFPLLEAQLRHAMRTEMVMHLEDFYLRRVPLHAARADHGLPWADRLLRVWAEERGLGSAAIAAESERLRAEIARRSEWKSRL